MDWIDTLDGWLEDAWRALRRRPTLKQRRARARMAGVASLSLAVHMAVLLYFGSQLTDAYRLPEPPEEIIPPVEPVEAILIPPPPETEPPPQPVLRRIDPAPSPQPPPVTVPPPRPAPPVPAPPVPQPAPAAPTPAPPAPAPPNPAPMAPIQPNPAPPAPINSTVRPLPSNLTPMARPMPLSEASPDPAPPSPAPPKKKEDEDDKPIGRTAPPNVAPRQAAPNAAPLTVAPLPMAPVPRSAAAPGAPSGGGARPAGPGGANGDFRVRPSGVIEGGLRGALRGSTVGCDHRVGVALNRDERTVCDERVGERGAKAPEIAVGTELSRDKRGRMQTQTELNEAMRAYRGAPATNTGPASSGAPAPRVRDLVGN